jgi:hypothetical protein
MEGSDPYGAVLSEVPIYWFFVVPILVYTS